MQKETCFEESQMKKMDEFPITFHVSFNKFFLNILKWDVILYAIIYGTCLQL